MSSCTVGIFVATMTGTAQMCAEEAETALRRAGIGCETVLMDGLEIDAFDRFEFLAIISSTYGHGDIPDNGQALFRAIEAAPSLVGRRFAVFGLGDRTYAATFCEAGRKWDELLAAKGASRVAPLMQHDASQGALPEDAAADWAASWAPLLAEAA